MLLLALGVILLVPKLMGVAWAADLAWPRVLAPFGGAALWWWADWSGYTQRKVMEKEEARKVQRLAQARDKLHPGQRP